MVPLMMLVSCLAIFPFVLFSMLAEGTVLAPYSAAVVKSFSAAGDGWLLFYMESFLLGLAAAIALVIAAVPSWIAAPIGGAILVTLAFIYFRLVGRLMWYCQQRLPGHE